MNDEFFRKSLTGLSVLLRYAMFIFILIKPVGSILGKRHRFRVRPRSTFRPVLCYGTPFLEVIRCKGKEGWWVKPFAPDHQLI